MKRKQIAFIFFLFLFTLWATFYASAAEIKTHDGFRYSIQNDSAIITGYSGKHTTLKIPESIDGYPVTEIHDLNSYDNMASKAEEDFATYTRIMDIMQASAVTGLFLPASVTKIHDGAFSGFPNLTEITVSEDNPTYVSKFNCIIEKSSQTLILGCKSSQIREGVSAIGKEAFAYSGIKTVTLPEGIVSIGENAFRGAFALDRITFPDSLKSIGDGAFRLCEDLGALKLSSGVESIGGGIIFGCKGLLALSVDKDNNTFYVEKNCIITRSDKTVVLACGSSFPENIEGIGNGAFCGILTEEDCILPDTISSIGDYAFQNNLLLKKLTIPASVEEIGIGIVDGCSFLSSIVVADENPRYYAEGNCLIEKETNRLVAACCTDVSIPVGVTVIDSHALDNLKETHIILPASITAIRPNAFPDHKNSSVEYAGAKCMWDVIEIDNSNSIFKNAKISFAKTDADTIAAADLDGDGIIRLKDVLLAANTGEGSDIDGDGTFTEMDVRWIAMLCTAK